MFDNIIKNNKIKKWVIEKLCERLDSNESCVHVFQFYLFQFFFFLRVNSNLTWPDGFTVQETKITIHTLFITVHALKNIKNGPYGTIHTFKNYFATVLSVFSFSNNKLNPKELYILTSLV